MPFPKKILLACLPVFIFFIAAAQDANEEDGPGFFLAAQTSMLNFDSMGAISAYGLSFEGCVPSVTNGLFIRNRYLVGNNYFKFSTVPLAVLIFGSGWISNGDNDANSDGDTTLRESCTGPVFRGILASAFLVFNDGFGYSIPIGKRFGIGPFISPTDLHFYRPPGGKFHLGAFTTFGIGLRATPPLFGQKAFIGAEGEYVRALMLKSSEAGYRVNFTAGISF
ncbi:MAG: hypothetical protein FD123_4361 [Bacteroidetes bacterium]|nr:MAG: hypothetical protein FD123_4361 [Bacteroidota bacterium]